MKRPGRKFALELALALGFANVDGMLAGMSSSQFTEWEAFFSISPYGTRAETLRAGLVAATVANFSPASKKHDFSPADFLPRQPEKKSLAKKALAIFELINARRAKK